MGDPPVAMKTRKMSLASLGREKQFHDMIAKVVQAAEGDGKAMGTPGKPLWICLPESRLVASSSSSSSSSLRTDLFSCAAPSSPSSSTHHEAPAPALWRLVQALEQAQRESQAMDERIRTMLLDEHEQAARRQERLTSMMEEAKAAVSLFTQGAATDLSA